MSFGLDPDAFWRKTPRELSLIFAGAGDRLRREQDERMSLAWHVAALMRTDARKFPKLEKLLSRSARRGPRPRQTPEQMLAIARLFTVAAGGEIIAKDQMN